MKILFCSPTTVRNGVLDYGFWNFVVPMRKLGHNVDYYDYRHHNTLASRIEETKPDVVFCICTGSESQEFYSTIESLKQKIYCINLSADDSWRYEDFTSKICDLFSMNYTTESSYLNDYSAPVKYTTWPVDIDLFKTIKIGRSKYQPFLIYGSLAHPQRQEYIRELKDIPVRYVRDCITYEELVGHMCSSHVVINFAECSKGGKRQSKARVFESLAAGSCLLTEVYPDLDIHLDKGEYISFDGKQDFLNKVKRVVENIEKVQYVADKGNAKFLEKYDAQKIIQEMLNEY